MRAALGVLSKRGTHLSRCWATARPHRPAHRPSGAIDGCSWVRTTSAHTMVPRRRHVAGEALSDGEGARMAEQLLDNAEETVEKLERSVGATQAEAHLGPAPEVDGEQATVWYFAFGSNINKKVFEGRRRIKPAESVPAVLPGWRLAFSQPGLPYAEPAFAAVERVEEGGASDGAPAPEVHGVAHRITPAQWAYVLETEGGSGGKEKEGGHAYTVVEAEAVDYQGRQLGVLTLTVTPAIKARLKGRPALPSLRYMTLIRDGAKDYGLAPDYQAWLATLPHYRATAPGQKVGRVLFQAIAFTFIFPVWAGLRVLRRVTGMKAAAEDDFAGRWQRRYTAFLFKTVLDLHELLRPVLGCGMA